MGVFPFPIEERVGKKLEGEPVGESKKSKTIINVGERKKQTCQRKC